MAKIGLLAKQNTSRNETNKSRKALLQKAIEQRDTKHRRKPRKASSDRIQVYWFTYRLAIPEPKKNAVITSGNIRQVFRSFANRNQEVPVIDLVPNPSGYETVTIGKLKDLKTKHYLNEEEFQFLCGVLGLPEEKRQRRLDTTLRQIMKARDYKGEEPTVEQLTTFHRMCESGEIKLRTEEDD